jgi:hypothetical protein
MFDVDPPNGEEMEQILRRAHTTPKALAQRAAEFNGSGGRNASYQRQSLVNELTVNTG